MIRKAYSIRLGFFCDTRVLSCLPFNFFSQPRGKARTQLSLMPRVVQRPITAPQVPKPASAKPTAKAMDTDKVEGSDSRPSHKKMSNDDFRTMLLSKKWGRAISFVDIWLLLGAALSDKGWLYLNITKEDCTVFTLQKYFYRDFTSTRISCADFEHSSRVTFTVTLFYCVHLDLYKFRPLSYYGRQCHPTPAATISNCFLILL